MKKICLIARQNVYTGVEHKIMDDYGLKAVDGIRYGKEKLINDNYTLSSIANDLNMSLRRKIRNGQQTSIQFVLKMVAKSKFKTN